MGKDTIVVVDDDHLVASFIAGKLLPRLGYNTLIANDGKSALELVRRNNISLMLLDLELPDMTGIDLLRRLVNDGYQLPTIMITGHGSESVAIEAFRLGVMDYLSKPVDTGALIDALNRGLTQTRLRREKEQLTNQLKEQVSWLKALLRVGRTVTSTLDTDEVLRRIVAAGVELTHAQEGFLALLDENNGRLYLRAVKNIDGQKSETMRLAVDDSLVGAVVRSGKPYRTFQSADEPRLKVCTGYLVQSLLHVPVISRGKVIGVLSVDNPASSEPFDEDDETRLMSLADYAAVALENANLYTQAQLELNERTRAELALRDSEERYSLAVQGANDGIWDWNLKTNRIYYSERWKSILGYYNGNISAAPEEWYSRVHPEDLERLKLDIAAHIAGTTPHFENEHRLLHDCGDYRWVHSRGLAVRDQHGLAYRLAGSLTDITDRKIAEQRLLHDAFHDTLTGLPNRALFLDRLRFAVERAKRRPENTYAVLFLDLDRFKNVNDSLGHMVGDELLMAVAGMLKQGLRTTDTVARLGGDEFVILLEDTVDQEGVIRVAQWINEQLKNAFNLTHHKVFITTSIGIVYSTLNYNRPEDVLRDADIAMYSAKAQGRARYEVFEPSMRVKITDNLTLETELRQALECGEFLLNYQPIVSLENNRLTGFEALLRWQHPTRGLLFPGDFLPVAEDTGLIIPIDRWVLRTACRQVKIWQELFPHDTPLTISVNLTGKQIAQLDFVEFIEHALEESGLPPLSLKLEVTESDLMENTKSTIDVFKRLRTIGVQIQVDDFGIGYSSLSYLSQFPVTALKIDQSFINKMMLDGNQLKIVQAIVMLTQRLDVVVVAEGVENEAQLHQLREMGCEFGQGYYLSRPLDAESAHQLLEEIASKQGMLEGVL
jgi:diguanylate cyclase (GGDEF)-like protein/PAS domain S-box-containing protein